MKALSNKRLSILCALVVFLLLAFCVSEAPKPAFADEQAQPSSAVEEKHITSAADFLSLVALSRERDTSNWVVYLDNDIELGSDDMQTIVNHTVKHLSFGNSDHPFAGTFDGQNHTVTGLKYANNSFDPERDTGFFAETKGATIKNFLVKDADVWADFRGGIIAGKAVDTHIENVMVMESTLHVTCANNALNLITNAGFEGGIIAGELDGCSVYNCEVRGGRAVNNTTSGVQALGGEGLYMAAFAGYVGKSDSGNVTTIEYSRVTPTRNEDGSAQANTDVTNKYDVAVGALGGNNVYASGFVGRMGDGAHMVDCFSTASCYSYSASYVGVVAVTLAWSGGLAGRIDKANGNVIERCHYAGDLSSRQYNPVAVIPIIQNDVNLGGIAGRASAGDATITDCYFKPSVSLNGSSQGTASKKTIYALADDKTMSGDGFGAWSDDRYVDRTLWEDHDYDFSGGTARTSANDGYVGASHGNAWAMDYKLGIPVHGASVKATLDFPGAGSVTIDSTKLGTNQSTDDPYHFAVSAILAGTAQGLAEGDTSVTFEQQTSDKPAGLSESNGGFRFMGWFREPSVFATSIDEDNSWFDGKNDDAASDAGKRVEENSEHLPSSSYTADNAGGSDAFKGNDLFIASYQAQVLFHDANGTVLNAETGEEHADTSDDWYRYGTGITPAIPQVKPSSQSATFIGWTSKANDSSGSNGGYVGITSTELTALKNAGTFVPAGQAVTVTAPTDYYPIYTDYASNILTTFEGNEQDSLDDQTQRSGVGKTHVAADASAASTEYTVQVQDANGKALSDGGALPDGYRFLGWYETKQVNGADVEVRVSRDSDYQLPASVDLTVPHTYTARFEYRVDYYGITTRLENSELNNPFVEKDANGNFVAKAYASNWQGYKTAFVERGDAPLDAEDAFAGWYQGAGTVNHGKADTCSAARVTSEKKVVEPFSVHAHVSGDNTTYNIYITDDFPGAATLSNSGSPGLSSFTVSAQPNSGYGFYFWDCERDGNITNNSWTSRDNPWKAGAQLTTHTYAYTAHLLAEVNFYWKSGQKVDRQINGRAYQEKLLSGEIRSYKFPFTGSHIANPGDHSGNPGPSGKEMAVPGYKFLGWITTAEVQKDSGVWSYIYDVSGDSFVTSDPAKAAPYLVTDDYRVTQAQDVYPVYAKYNVNYDTNLHRAGFNGTDSVNAPNWQITPSVSEADGVTTATVRPDITTPVYKGGDELYKLEKVEIEYPDGTVHHLEGHGDDGNTYTATIDAGGSYTFVAYYSPLAVVYHLNAADIDGKVAQAGDTLGKLQGGIPKPTFDVADIDTAEGGYHQFVGWTSDKPSGSKNYVIWSQPTDLVNAGTVVNAPMELYPVYRSCSLTVQSNIDGLLADPGSVRGLSRTASGDQVSLQVKAASEVQGTDGKTYDFVGWSNNYRDDSSYSLLNGDTTYALEGSESFSGTVYTAVYKQSPWKVRYHDADGSVIYEASVESGDDRATGAGFVHDMEIPKVDESGNPVYNDDGTQQTETRQVAYDPDAYVDESEELSSRAAGKNGVYKEMFLRWRSIDASGNATDWDGFKDQPITGDMDLYPVTFYVTAHDTSNNAEASAANNITAKMKWQLDPNASGDVSDDVDNARIKACFAEAFEGTQLTIHVEHVEYRVPENGEIECDQTCVNDQSVSLYSKGVSSGSFDKADWLATKVTGADGQGEGNAVFEFSATNSLTLIKQTTDSWAAGKTFQFKVTKEATDSSDEQVRMVSITVAQTPSGSDENGNPLYEGTAVLKVPAGSYRVEEDEAWAWRYDSELYAQGLAPGPSATVSISAASSANDATVTCSNARSNSQWIDGASRAKNVWADGKVARKGE